MNKEEKDLINKIAVQSQEELKKLLEEARKKVGQIDKQIINLLDERFYYSKLIGKLKSELNLPVYNLQIEKKIIGNLLEHNLPNLSQKSLKGIYERILDESRAVQRSEYKKKK